MNLCNGKSFGLIFEKKIDPLENVLADNQILTFFELFMVELPYELFRQLKCESQRTLLQPNENRNPNYQKTWRKKNLFTTAYTRNVTNRISFPNCLGKAYI